MALGLLAIFAVLVAMAVPIAFALGLTALLVTLIWDLMPLTTIFQQMYRGVDSFTLLALPLFILAGELMLRTGIIEDVLAVCDRLITRHIRGGIAQVNVAASMFFAGISGSAVADTAAMSTALIPSMRKSGFPADFSVGLTAASSVIGPIIPPSIAMVIYGSITGVPISALFAGGIIPGILFGLGLMSAVYYYSRRYGYGEVTIELPERKADRQQPIRLLGALLLPVIILGGILSGVFTPTEASVVGCVYALVLGLVLYRNLGLADYRDVLLSAMIVSGSVLFIIAAAAPLGWIVAMARLPELLVGVLSEWSLHPLIILLLINVFLLILGSIMEANVNILIFAPILAPAAVSLGLDPLHFGVVFVLNIVIGLATPPLGVCIFVACGIADVPLDQAFRAIIPFILVLLAVLLLVILFPELALFLPRTFGLI